VLAAKSPNQVRHTLTTSGAAEDNVCLRRLSVNIEQQAVIPDLTYLFARFINCVVKSGIRRLRFNSFISVTGRAIGIDVFAVEAGNDKNGLSPDISPSFSAMASANSAVL
jgi:hypothetical protein